MPAIMGLNSAVTYLAVFAGTAGVGAVYATLGFVASAILAAGLTLISAWVGSRQVAQPIAYPIDNQEEL